MQPVDTELNPGRAILAPHRHDTCAIGSTLRSVQSFRYRGTAEHSLPGQVSAHPDEIHDGHAGTTVGFRWRAVRKVRELLNAKCRMP